MIGNKQIVGKCSICGGIVSAPAVFMSVVPPVPTCESCGASEDQSMHLPTVPMKPREHYVRPRSAHWHDTHSILTGLPFDR